MHTKKIIERNANIQPRIKNTKGNKTNGSRTENKKPQIVSSGAKRDTTRDKRATVKETRELDATGDVDEQGEIVINCFLVLFLR